MHKHNLDISGGLCMTILWDYMIYIYIAQDETLIIETVYVEHHYYIINSFLNAFDRIPERINDRIF